MAPSCVSECARTASRTAVSRPIRFEASGEAAYKEEEEARDQVSLFQVGLGADTHTHTHTY